MKEYQHDPVLLSEVIKYLNIKKKKTYLDGTLGGGGHSEAILKKKGKVLALEVDKAGREYSRKRLKKYSNDLLIKNKSYIHLAEVVAEYNLKISGIILDLGLSSYHLDQSKRGFSFRDKGNLDMRFDNTKKGITASDIVLKWPESKLVEIFREYGEIKKALSLTRGIIAARKTVLKQKQKFVKTSLFVKTILRIFHIKESSLGRFKTHPATKVFQALRIAVNNELNNIRKVLPQALDVLEPGGRLVIISFHSLEDRIVKQYFKENSKKCICPPQNPICNCQHKASIKIITKKGIKASSEERKKNKRSRSAILRVAEKIK